MSIEYLHYVASFKKNIKNQYSSSDKHISLPKETSSPILLYNNKKLTNTHPNPHIKKNKKYRVLLAESNAGVRAMIKLFLDSLNLYYIAVDNGDEALRLFSNTLTIGGRIMMLSYWILI